MPFSGLWAGLGCAVRSAMLVRRVLGQQLFILRAFQERKEQVLSQPQHMVLIGSTLHCVVSPFTPLHLI